MRILITSPIRKYYANQIEYNIDLRLIKFLNFVFGKKIKIDSYFEKIINKPNLIIIAGGNDIPSQAISKSDYIRNKQSNYIYNYAIKKKIPLVGICYGAQFVGYKNKFSFKKYKLIKPHIIKLNNKIIYFKEKSLKVNSFKNLIIKKTNNSFKDLFFAKDKSVECFLSKIKKF